MTEDIDDSQDSEKTYRIFNNNISNQRSLLYSYNTLDDFCDRSSGRTVQQLAVAGIHNRPSIGLSCW